MSNLDPRTRLLVVLLAISIVIVAVVVAGLYLFYPVEGENAVAAAQPAPTQARLFDPIEYLKEGDGRVTDPLLYDDPAQRQRSLTSEEAPSEEAPIVTSEDKRVADPTDTPRKPPQGPEERAQQLRRALQSAQQRDSKKSMQPTAAARPPSSAPAKPPTKAAPSTKKASKPPASRSAPAVVQTPRPAPARYWIQLFSSRQLESTQRAQLELAQYQIEGVISKVHIEGVDYYRLRVGPFLSKNEAEKFIVWFQNNDQFAGSYVVYVASR